MLNQFESLNNFKNFVLNVLAGAIASKHLRGPRQLEWFSK